MSEKDLARLEQRAVDQLSRATDVDVPVGQVGEVGGELSGHLLDAEILGVGGGELGLGTRQLHRCRPVSAGLGQCRFDCLGEVVRFDLRSVDGGMTLGRPSTSRTVAFLGLVSSTVATALAAFFISALGSSLGASVPSFGSNVMDLPIIVGDTENVPLLPALTLTGAETAALAKSFATCSASSVVISGSDRIGWEIDRSRRHEEGAADGGLGLPLTQDEAGLRRRLFELGPGVGEPRVSRLAVPSSSQSIDGLGKLPLIDDNHDFGGRSTGEDSQESAVDQASATARLGDALLVVDLQSCFRRLHLRLVRAGPDLDGPRRCGPSSSASLVTASSGVRPPTGTPGDDRLLRYVVTGHGVRDAVQRADDYQQRTGNDSHRDARVQPPPGRLPRSAGGATTHVSSCSGVWVLTSGPYGAIGSKYEPR